MKDSNDKKSSDSQSDSTTKRDRVIGEGMTSLDSTQAPLKTSDGLPDYQAMTGGKEPSARDEDEESKSK
jgi:hypothetical protein